MRRKLIARTAKLLSEAKRSRRHQGIAVAYEHIPNDIDERNHGAIYAVVNINAPSGSAEEVGELIIDTFHGEFYQDLSRDPISSFESALARVNEELAEVTHQGNIAWLNNLHAVLAVLSGDQLHITQTGRAESYLYRGGRSSHVTHDLAGDNVNPLRTFINIASGDLVEGDKVAIVTPGVFFHVSKDELQKYVQEFQPKVAISHLADLLEENNGEVHPNSILILEAITPEAASEETITELDDEVWITEAPKPVQTAIEKSAPFAKKTLFYIKKYFGIVSAFAADTLWPKTTELVGKAGKAAFKLIRRNADEVAKIAGPHREKVLTDTEESIISEGGKENLEDLTINENTNELVGRVEVVNPNAIYIKETVNKPKFLSIDLSSAKRATSKFGKKFFAFGKNRRAVLYTAVALVIVLGFGLLIAWNVRTGAEKQKQATASLTEAQSKYDIAGTQLTAGNRQQAATTLQSALSLTDGLKNNAKLKVQASALADKIRAALDSAEGIVHAQATSLADASQIVGSDTFGPYLVGTNLYVISKTDASIASISVTGGEVARVLDKPNLDGKITAAAAVPVRSALVFFTDAGKIYEFDTKDVKLTQQTVAGDFEKVTALASFSTNIYSLDSSTGKIYKRLKTSSGYGARTEYITDGSSVSGAVGLAIDSNVYAMAPNGEVTKYLGGKKQTYAISGLPVTVSNATGAFTSEETIGLYELEGGASRVIRFDAQGSFINQYVSDNFKNASGLYIDDASKTLFAVSNGKIYKVSL